MTDAQRIYLNDFFVHVFNRILVWEEHALSQVGAQDLSVKELHVLEAVSDLTVQARNTMTAIAEALSIRVSSLTTAVTTLVRKGYLERGGEPGDRRVIRVLLTDKGEQANALHSQFHARMIDSATQGLTEQELDALIQSLKNLSAFFQDMTTQAQNA